jgi:chemotaxis protein MotB
MYSKVKKFIDVNNLEDTVEIKKDSRGIIMELKDNILFDIGKADIKEPSKSILDKISVLISSLPNDIIVEGHTDNVPISTYKFPSNWELSTQRAVNVLKYFVQTKKMNPGRFQAAGYGEYRPIGANDTYANRGKNRRVNILITASVKENK